MALPDGVLPDGVSFFAVALTASANVTPGFSPFGAGTLDSLWFGHVCRAVSLHSVLQLLFLKPHSLQIQSASLLVIFHAHLPCGLFQIHFPCGFGWRPTANP